MPSSKKQNNGLWAALGISAGFIILGIATRKYMRSKYFNLDDVNSAKSAKKHRVKDNSIPDHLMPNAQGLALHILDPLFESIADSDTVNITTWYRNKKLNEKVGGAEGSTHQEGATADVAISSQEGYKKAIANILRNSKFNRLAVYLGKNGAIQHLHVEWSKEPRNDVFYSHADSPKWQRTTVKELMRFIN